MRDLRLLTAVSTKIIILWDVMGCVSVHHANFGENFLPPSSEKKSGDGGIGFFLNSGIFLLNYTMSLSGSVM
jgi:hypothetical protein